LVPVGLITHYRGRMLAAGIPAQDIARLARIIG
jgi:hypothetical protein